MITVKVEKKNSKFRKVCVLGHAMYDDYGKDIVCSSVSSIVITTVNGIIALNKESLSYMVSKKGMTLTINSDERTPQILIRNMIVLLKELEKKYPENVEVK